ncbi:phage portal protein [Ferrovum sp.]|uniref:phage portal protein n=1 Tax=Ferrovum sp. TaxID=2609467 RepID=UPI002627CE91|nr:phage portal protein [Ferrovum sp.]
MGIRSWLSSFKANSDRSPWSGFWFEPVGVQTMAGMRVTADNALQLSAVFSCVRIISSQFASLPFVLYRTRRDGGKKRVTDHPLYPLLARRPNPYQNAFEWREMLAGHLVLRGNAFNQIVSNRQGEITALVPLHPDRVTIDLLPNGDYRYKYTTMTGSEQIFPRGQIWHLRGLSLDGIIGLSPIALARNAIGGAMAAQNYGSRFFANDAKPLSGYVEYPGSFKDKMAREQFRESLQESQTGANRGKIAVFEFGMKYHQLGLTNEDAQFLETRKFQVNDIARWFGVPPHKIGDLERSTNNNIEQQAQEFVQECLGPMAERWEASIEAELLFDDDGLEAEFLFSQLLRGDSQARAQYYNLGINGGWLTRNEARLSENLNPLPGLDRPLRPLNMAEEQNDGSDPTQPPTADNIDKPVPPLKNNSEESHETRALDV